jgi:hypothetical protein
VANEVAARERIAVTFGAALLAAGLLLVGAVLPAEYGIDPLGLGRWLGLTAMSDVQKSLDEIAASRSPVGAATIVAQERTYQDDHVSFALGPREFVEYKYRLEKGEALLFSWAATGPVDYELHAEPDGAPEGYAETFDKKSGQDKAAGTLIAPFSGIHGWYWENTTDQPITVTLNGAGFFNLAYEFRKDQPAKTKSF